MPASVVVGRRVKLVRAGREMKGLSPFNAEKSPSFYVNDQKQFYHCFSSGKHGDIFTFLMETEGVSFPEAVERLASEAGVTLPKVSEESELQEKKRAGLHEVLQLAAQFFQDCLRGRGGTEARRYLAGRNLPPDVQAEFGIGYAPGDRYALRDHLAGKDVPPADMIEAGLLVHGPEIAVPYDRFRDRVMFPIADRQGRVIAFGGRALQKDAPAKYLNSSETPLFHKGATLYNHHRARKAAHERGTVIAVEGYMDVIALTRAGFPHAVAPLGTALSEDQLGLMWRMSGEPVLCFDGDKAGQRAAHRAIDVALPLIGAGKTLRFAFLPAGQDPDDLLRSAGAAAVAAVLEKTEALVDVLWAREVERTPLTTPEQRADMERRLRDLVGLIRDDMLRKHYRSDIEQRLDTLSRAASGRAGSGAGARGQERGQGGGQGRIARGARLQQQGPASSSLRTAPVQLSASLKRSPLFATQAAYPAREIVIVMAAVNHAQLLHREVETLARIEFTAQDLGRLACALIDLVASDGGITGSRVRAHLETLGLGAVLARAEAALNPAEWWARPDADISDALTGWRSAVDLQMMQGSLHREIREIEVELGLEGSDVAYQRMRAVNSRAAAPDETAGEAENFAPKR